MDIDNLYQGFVGVAKKFPDVVAVSDGEHELTYSELIAKARVLSNYCSDLISTTSSIPPAQHNIAIAIPKSIDYIVSVVAVTMLDATFVPIDLSQPAKRIQNIITDSNVSTVLVTSQDIAAFQSNLRSVESIELIEMNDSLVLDSYAQHSLLDFSTTNPDCYIIYTSGSTGKPKGVVIQQPGLLNLCNFMQATLQIKAGESRILGFAPTTFDASIWEIFGAIMNGATYCIPKSTAVNPSELVNTINQLNVTHVTLPPSVLSLMSKESMPSLQCLVSAGEACLASVQEKWSDGSWQFFNAYGPTESTVCASITKISQGKKSLNIGNPILNMKLFVLDSTYSHVDEGETGELCIAGIGLAKGYCNDAKKTAEKFIDYDGKRLYRTGDLVCYLGPNNIEYVGRTDNQVKHRGYRIDLEEIDQVLQELDGINQAASIIAYEKEREQIVTFYTYLSEDINISDIKKHLKQCLPSYMMPSQFFMLSSLPLTNYGKIDRKNLQNHPLITTEINTPTNLSDNLNQTSIIEQKLCQIFSEAIGCQQVEPEDNFFEIGGHSLLMVQCLTLINENLGVMLNITDFLEDPTPKSLTKLMPLEVITEKSNEDDSDDSRNINIEDKFPLSEMQQAYFLGRHADFELGGIGTNVYREYSYKNIDVERLEQGLNQLIKRHDMLRCAIYDYDTQQILSDIEEFKITRHDLSTAADSESSNYRLELRKRLCNSVLPSDKPPLLDIHVLKVNDHQHYLMIVIDAIIMDGWSYELFFRELGCLYNDASACLPEIKISFPEYLSSIKTRESCNLQERDKKYWDSKIPSLPIGPNLPLKKQPKNIADHHFETLIETIPQEIWLPIKELAAENEVSPTALLVSLFTIVTSYWSTSEHYTLYLTLFNRQLLDKTINNVIGVFSSLLLIEVNVADKLSFLFFDYANHIQKEIYECLEHRNYPGTEIQKKHKQVNGYTAAASLCPLVFTSFLASNQEEYTESIFSRENLNYTVTQSSQIYLDAKVYEEKGSLIVEWNYLEEIFNINMLQEMFNTYLNLIKSVSSKGFSLTNIFQDIGSSLDLAIKKSTTVSPDTLLSRFIEQVKKTPENIAIIDDIGTLTYAELLILANTLAGVIPSGETAIALLIQRSRYQIISMIATWMSGACYLPIDIGQPIERIKSILNDARVNTVITSEQDLSSIDNSADILGKYNIVDPKQEVTAEKELSISAVEPESLAYIIYTSGSTGQPKGVAIAHKAVLNTLDDMQERFNISENDRTLMVSSYGFDLSVFDIFAMLNVGGAVVSLSDKNAKNPSHWYEQVLKHRVTIWNSVPLLAQLYYEELANQSITNKLTPLPIRLFLLSGDWVPLRLSEKLRTFAYEATSSDLKIVSLGGATEASIWSILYEIGDIDNDWTSIPYGCSMDNQQVFIMDKYGNKPPVSVVGDLYIAGRGLAREYFNNTLETEKRFIKLNNNKIYATGDRGSYMNDCGLIQFNGRIDNQLKINGHRVELEEISFQLSQYPKVEQAVVIDLKTDNKILLFGFCKLKDNYFNKLEIQNFLRKRLPEYMLPYVIINIDNIPLTDNGKLDRSSLIYLAKEELSSKKETSSVRNTNPKLREIWCEILKADNFNAEDDFFHMGADSISTIRLTAQIKRHFGFDVHVEQVIQLRTLGAMSDYIEELSANKKTCSRHQEEQAIDQ